MTAARARRGAASRRRGAAAEDAAARLYEARGATILARNWRAPREDGGGEIDLIVRDADGIAFVEVKSGTSAIRKDVIRESQWGRLEKAALRYSISTQTGDVDLRFDAAFVGPDGTVEVVRNARGHD
jgi:Predicted endonuclease distantly related to archaeal Holliday junction resolvase